MMPLPWFLIAEATTVRTLPLVCLVYHVSYVRMPQACCSGNSGVCYVFLYDVCYSTIKILISSGGEALYLGRNQKPSRRIFGLWWFCPLLDDFVCLV